MRYLYGIAAFLLCGLVSVSIAETIIPGGSVSGTWDVAGSPYLIQGNINVPEDLILSIEAGVEVIFEGHYSVEVIGILDALGTEGDSVVFTSNAGVTWSGFKYTSNSEISHVYYCLFENVDNYPSGYGGVFYVYESNIEVEHCTFQYNRANRGAAMYVLWGHVKFRYNVCHNNEAEHCGGAINFGVDAESVVERCLFYDNTASSIGGGAIYFWDNHCPVINCTIVDNSEPAILSSNETTSEFINCIFWYNEMGSVYAASYCDILGGYPGTGNIDENPLFADPGNHNYHLQPESPCIDAGDPASPPDPDGSRADMGAYYCEQGPSGNLTVILEPVNPPIVIPPGGGSLEFVANVYCDEAGSAFYDAWTELVLPDGQITEPLILRNNLFLAAGASVSRDCNLYISMWAMPGIYEYHGMAGEYPGVIYAEDFFEFEKEIISHIAPDDAGAYAVLQAWGLEEQFNLPVGESILPDKFAYSSSPNPFNPKTTIRFTLPAADQTRLTIYDISGRVVANLLNRRIEAGSHQVSFDAEHLASGVYLSVLDYGGESYTLRLLLIK